MKVYEAGYGDSIIGVENGIRFFKTAYEAIVQGYELIEWANIRYRNRIQWRHIEEVVQIGEDIPIAFGRLGLLTFYIVIREVEVPDNTETIQPIITEGAQSWDLSAAKALATIIESGIYTRIRSVS